MLSYEELPFKILPKTSASPTLIIVDQKKNVVMKVWK